MTFTDLDLVFLDVDDIVSMHDDQLHHFGGSAGIRDRGALESAVAVPSSTFDGSYLHADLFEMAAAYAFNIAENQPFLDGNKRTGLNAAVVFLDLNGWLVLDPAEITWRDRERLASDRMQRSNSRSGKRAQDQRVRSQLPRQQRP